MPDGFIRYSDPIDTILSHLERIEEQGGFVKLTEVVSADSGRENVECICVTSVVDVIDALADGRLARDALYKVEYVAELVDDGEPHAREWLR
jgi:hypothetical protein